MKTLKYLLVAIVIKLTFTSFSTKYPEPEYYTIHDSELLTIKCSRAIYHDINGIIEETTDQVYKKYDNQSQFEIERTAILMCLEESRQKTQLKIDSVMFEFHDNFGMLSKCCQK